VADLTPLPLPELEKGGKAGIPPGDAPGAGMPAEEKMRHMKSTLSRIESELTDIRSRSRIEKEIRIEERNRLEKENEKLKNEISEIKEQRSRFIAIIEQNDKDIRDVRARSEQEMKRTYDQFQKDRILLEQSLRQANQRLEEKDVKINEISESLAKATVSRNNMENELSETRHKLQAAMMELNFKTNENQTLTQTGSKEKSDLLSTVRKQEQEIENLKRQLEKKARSLSLLMANRGFTSIVEASASEIREDYRKELAGIQEEFERKSRMREDELINEMLKKDRQIEELIGEIARGNRSREEIQQKLSMVKQELESEIDSRRVKEAELMSTTMQKIEGMQQLINEMNREMKKREEQILLLKSEISDWNRKYSLLAKQKNQEIISIREQGSAVLIDTDRRKDTELERQKSEWKTIRENLEHKIQMLSDRIKAYESEAGEMSIKIIERESFLQSVIDRQGGELAVYRNREISEGRRKSLTKNREIDINGTV